MGIYIPNMEMPQRCKACRFCGFGGRRSELNVCMFTGESQPKLSQERMSKCPLVPLPEGHGRLIDADALMEIIRAHDYPLTAHFNSTDNGMFTLGIQQAVNESPTIVPAEGGGEE